MNVTKLFIDIDSLLTGKPDDAASTAQQQRHKLADPVDLFACDGYYLSDGGYSRLIAQEGDEDPSDCKLYLSGVSRDAVKARWNDRDVIIIRRQIETVLSAAVKASL